MLARARIFVVLGLAALGIAACGDLETPAPPPDTTASSTPSVASEVGEAPARSCTRDQACPMLDCKCDRYDARIQKCTSGICETCADIGCSPLQ